jgi:hypothetical protein
MNVTGWQATAFLGFLGVAAGSFMPWVRAGLLSVAGTDGDGVITLALAGIGFTLVLIRIPVLAVLAAVAAAGIGINAAVNVSDAASGNTGLFTVEVGTGLYLLIASALAAAAGSVVYAGQLAPAKPRAHEAAPVQPRSDSALCSVCGAANSVTAREARTANAACSISELQPEGDAEESQREETYIDIRYDLWTKRGRAKLKHDWKAGLWSDQG